MHLFLSKYARKSCLWQVLSIPKNAEYGDFEQKTIYSFITYAKIYKYLLTVFIIREYLIIKIWIQNQISDIKDQTKKRIREIERNNYKEVMKMSQITITLLFLAFAIIMFMLEKIPLGVTSMIVCVGLVVTGVLDWQTAFSGFIDSNVILFVAMFIVGGAHF